MDKLLIAKANSNLRLLSKLSLICFSRNRKSELRRLLTHYSQFPIQLIILEGSERAISNQINIELESQLKNSEVHELFKFNFVSAKSLPERSIIAAKLIAGEYCVNVGDDDFVAISGIIDAIMCLEHEIGYVGAFKSRNVSKKFVSSPCEEFKVEYLQEGEAFKRLELVMNKGFTDIPWMCVLRGEAVKDSLTLAGNSTIEIWREDRFSANLWSSTFVASIIAKGPIILNKSCLFFKRSFDVKPDPSFQIMHEPNSINLDNLRLNRELEAINFWLPKIKPINVNIIGHEIWNEKLKSRINVVQNYLLSQNIFGNINKYRFKKAINNFRRAKEKIWFTLQRFIRLLAVNKNKQESDFSFESRPHFFDFLILKWRVWSVHKLIHNCLSCQEAKEYFA